MKTNFIFSWTVQSIQSQREKFYNQIQHNLVNFNQLSCTELVIKLMNSQNFYLNSHLLKFISLYNDLRNNLLSNRTDDTIVIRGDWLWKAANINDKNNSAAVYVQSTVKVHNPLFSVGKLLRNKLMQRFYWSIQSKW